MYSFSEEKYLRRTNNPCSPVVFPVPLIHPKWNQCGNTDSVFSLLFRTGSMLLQLSIYLPSLSQGHWCWLIPLILSPWETHHTIPSCTAAIDSDWQMAVSSNVGILTYTECCFHVKIKFRTRGVHIKYFLLILDPDLRCPCFSLIEFSGLLLLFSVFQDLIRAWKSGGILAIASLPIPLPSRSPGERREGRRKMKLVLLNNYLAILNFKGNYFLWKGLHQQITLTLPGEAGLQLIK